MKSNLTYLKKPELFKLLDRSSVGPFFAIADSKVRGHLPQWIQGSPNVFWVTAPEEQKSLKDYGAALEFFLRAGVDRSATLFAIGGGATTDLGGFVAATILRGISWVSVPTTLLAMVDGSIGGKVAVNLPEGKNLVGAFHLPKEVLVCGEFLSTLPPEEWLSGKGEIVKYGLLSREIHDLIVARAPLEEISFACAKFKNDLVDRDLQETGDRIFLNLGHTLGHAFEFQLKIPHGQAVVLGMRYLFRIQKLPEPERLLTELLSALDMPEDQYSLARFPGFEPQEFLGLIGRDKKKSKSRIRLVLVKDVGKCYVEEVPVEEFKSKVKAYVEVEDK